MSVRTELQLVLLPAESLIRSVYKKRWFGLRNARAGGPSFETASATAVAPSSSTVRPQDCVPILPGHPTSSSTMSMSLVSTLTDFTKIG